MLDIYIPNEGMVFIQEAIKKAGKNEVGGLGTIEYSEDGGAAYIGNLFLPKQTVSSAEVNWGNDGIPEFLEFLQKNGHSALSWGLYSWHSHNNMSTFWSATDESFIRTAGDDGVPYIVSSCFNNKGEEIHRLDVFFDNSCALLDRSRQQVIWKDDDAPTITTLFKAKAREQVSAINEIAAERDREVEKLTKEYDKRINDVRSKLGNSQKEVADSVKAKLDEIWGDRVVEDPAVRQYAYSYNEVPGMCYWDWENELDDTSIMEDLHEYAYDEQHKIFVNDTPNRQDYLTIPAAKEMRVSVYSLKEDVFMEISVYKYLMNNGDTTEDGEYCLAKWFDGADLHDKDAPDCYPASAITS